MWDAKQYDIFTKQRQQPAKDLLSRIINRKITDINKMSQQDASLVVNKMRILDVGCGSGMSTLPLLENWPKGEIIGVDNSEEMLKSAKNKSHKITWLKRDCRHSLEDLGQFDIVFSNAFLQWIPNQEEFFYNIAKNLKPDGCLALQVPAYEGMPAEQVITSVVTKHKRDFISIPIEGCHNSDITGYYEMSSKVFSKVEIWQTNYGHIMPSHETIVDFFRGSALHPYLSLMSEQQQTDFLNEICMELKQKYPIMSNGNIMFTFPRIFILAEL